MELIGVITDIENAAKEKFSEKDGDYIGEDGLLHCGVCKEKKQGRYQMPWGEVTPYIMCKCEREKKEAEEAEAKKAEREKIILENKARAFPKEEREKMQCFTFANDDRADERITKAMQNYVNNFTEFKSKGKGLLLYGACGRGKTYAACEVANALLDEGYSVKVTNFARIANELQGTFEKQEYIDSLNRYSLLVLDDLSAERDTEYMNEQVFQVVDARYRANLPMIITTNLAIETLKNPQNITKQRIYERIMERCHPICVEGTNKRREKIKQDYAEMQKMLGLS